MRKSLVVALAMASIATSVAAAPASAQSASSVSASVDPRHFDIAGVKIGMSPIEARETLAAHGYTVGADNTDTLGYDARLRDALRERNPEHPYASAATRVRSFSASGSAGEKVVISFLDTPTGAQVHEVSLSLSAAESDLSGIREDVMAKYGQPTVARDRLGSAWWCRRSETRCDRVGFTDTVLEFSNVGGVTLRLTDENRMRRETETAIEAEVDRRYPRKSASF